jgi:hypothetical protein
VGISSLSEGLFYSEKELCSSGIVNMYRIIHNSLTHFMKSVHSNGRKDCSLRPTYGKRNSLSFFFFVHFGSDVSVRPLWYCRRQADNPFPPIPAAECYDRFLRWDDDSSPHLRQILCAGCRQRGSLTYSCNTKSHGIRSGDLGGQRSNAWSSASLRPIQRWGKCWLRYRGHQQY